MNKNLRIKFSTFESVYDTVNVTSFDEKLSTFENRFKSAPIASNRGATNVFALASFGSTKNNSGSLRHAHNVLYYHGIVLDVDNKFQDYLLFDDAIQKLITYYFIAYTTFNSTKSVNKFRIVIPFFKEIEPKHLSHVVNHFKKVLNAGDALDNASSTISQVYYLPVCKSSSDTAYQYYINDHVDSLFDPSSLLVNVPLIEESPKSQEQKQKRAAVESCNFKKINVQSLKISKACKRLIVTGDATKFDNDRSKLVFYVVLYLARKQYDQDTIASILLDSSYGISERNLEKGQAWTLDDIERILNKVLPDEYYKSQETLNAKDAAKLMQGGVGYWMQHPKGNRAVKASAGIGKSQAILQSIAKLAFYKFFEVYVPTHKLAEEIKEKLIAYNSNIKVKVIRGRTFKDENDPNGEALCKKLKLVYQLYDYGCGIYDTVCKEKCEFAKKTEKHDRCAYLEQFHDDTQVRIFTHAHLPLSRGFLDLRMPDIAIIDESFYLKVMLDNKETTLKDISLYIKNESLANLLVDSLSVGQPLLSNLRQRFRDDVVDVLEKAAKDVCLKLPELNFDIKNQTVETDINPSIKHRNVLSEMLTTLKTELQKFPSRENSVAVRYVKDTVIVAGRNEITRFTRKKSKDDDQIPEPVPVLCIDADFNKEIASLFLPNIKSKTLPVKRNAHITQIYSTTNARSRFYARDDASKKEIDAVKQHIDNVQRIINNVHEQHGETLIVSNKKIEPLLKLKEGMAFEHFGALLGLNAYEDYKAAVIIGRLQLPIHELESQAAALWWDSDRELIFNDEPLYETRGYRLSDKSKFGARVLKCADYRVEMLQELQRERETLQALDRLRLIHNPLMKHVYILCNVPLDIDVDRLVSFKQITKWRSRIEDALIASNGILPISPSYLAKTYPNIFKNERAANTELDKLSFIRLKDDTISKKKPVFIGHIKYHLSVIKIKGQRGKHTNVLSEENCSLTKLKCKLNRLLSKKVDIVATTIKKRGLEDLKPKISKMDDFVNHYYANRHYDAEIGEWCVTILD